MVGLEQHGSRLSSMEGSGEGVSGAKHVTDVENCTESYFTRLLRVME